MMEFSSHADQVELINLLKTGSKIKKIIINHGDTEQSEGLALEIERQLKVETVIPKYKDIIKL
jgi:predicted metal-dependent RNase